MPRFICSYACDIACYEDFVVEATTEKPALRRIRKALRSARAQPKPQAMHQFNTTKLAKFAVVQTAPPTAQQARPEPARRSRPIRHFNPLVERVRSRKRYRELFRRYGIPNAVDVGRGIFGRTGAAFVDDHDDGRIIAYAPPWVASPRRRTSQSNRAGLS